MAVTICSSTSARACGPFHGTDADAPKAAEVELEIPICAADRRVPRNLVLLVVDGRSAVSSDRTARASFAHIDDADVQLNAGLPRSCMGDARELGPSTVASRS
jgi:hypothetical protein